MNQAFLIITTIANQDNPVLNIFSRESLSHNIPLILIGDTKSPAKFDLDSCDYYSIDRQKGLEFKLAEILPHKHYSRKNLGYLLAMSKGAEIIIETDDDNLPFSEFWNKRERLISAHSIKDASWVNTYKYFTDKHIWPRGFPLENLKDKLASLEELEILDCPIQQGLVDKNPDVDAIYRLTQTLPFIFDKSNNIALGQNSFCPFNSQNTTWFKDVFPLLYLPYYCSFRMTDIWRSFVAQRILWTCGWSVLFHQSTVWQERNDHDLMDDFRDELSGYNNNDLIFKSLKDLKLKDGIENISENMIICYQKLIDLNLINKRELELLNAWFEDIHILVNNNFEKSA